MMNIDYIQRYDCPGKKEATKIALDKPIAMVEVVEEARAKAGEQAREEVSVKK